MSTQITIAELKEKLAIYPNDSVIDFSGLDFSRVKSRGDKLVQIEFIQTVYRNAQGDVVVENHEQ